MKWLNGGDIFMKILKIENVFCIFYINNNIFVNRNICKKKYIFFYFRIRINV